jgi:hypothetical protein
LEFGSISSICFRPETTDSLALCRAFTSSSSQGGRGYINLMS